MSNATMQAIQAHNYGGPEVLVLEKVSRPISLNGRFVCSTPGGYL